MTDDCFHYDHYFIIISYYDHYHMAGSAIGHRMLGMITRAPSRIMTMMMMNHDHGDGCDHQSSKKDHHHSSPAGLLSHAPLLFTSSQVHQVRPAVATSNCQKIQIQKSIQIQAIKHMLFTIILVRNPCMIIRWSKQRLLQTTIQHPLL